MRWIFTFFVATIGFCSLAEQGNRCSFSNLKSQYVAGDSIRLTLSLDSNIRNDFLLISHSYGQTVLKPISTDVSKHTYLLPSVISDKSGYIQLKLMMDHRVLCQAETKIVADTSSNSSLEAFSGPKHLLTSANDFSMTVATVLDVHDNPYPEESPVHFHSLIERQENTKVSQMHNLLAYQRTYAPDQNGYGVVSVTYENLGHQEFRLDFYSNDPSDYSISYSRQHDYADGQQLIQFSTSKIKDESDNLMGNGTLVYFYITDEEGKKSMSTSQILEGCAYFSIPAPSSATSWKVSSEIPYYAKSNALTIDFESAIQSAPIEVLPNKTIQIGPVKSYMGQFAKDGTEVYLKLYNTIDTLNFQRPLEKGMAKFNLNQSITKGSYFIQSQIGDYTSHVQEMIQYE